MGGSLVLYEILADQHIELSAPGIGIILEGEFTVNETKLQQKDIFLLPQGKVAATGAGRFYIATSK